MIESINSGITQLVDFLAKLNGLPGYALVLLLCLGCGFLFKTIRFIPNGSIPMGVVLMGAIFNMLLADTRADALPFRLWIGKNFVFGAIIGLLAWMLHHNRYRIPLLKKLFSEEKVEASLKHDIKLKEKELVELEKSNKE